MEWPAGVGLVCWSPVESGAVRPGAPGSGLAGPVVGADWGRGTVLDCIGRDLAGVSLGGCAGLSWTLVGSSGLFSALYVLTTL